MRLRQQETQSIKPLAVSEIVRASKTLLEEYFHHIEIFGEVSSVTYQQNSGHVYFSLKDASSEIKCTFFKFYASKIDFIIKKGDMLHVTGKITLYEARGEYQLQVYNVKPYDNVGLLHYNLEKLKEELKQKGYFDLSRKKTLPAFVRKIALVTSPNGAVIHDMKTVANKRWKDLEIFLIPTLVQGEFAPEDIAKNIRFADQMGVDVIVIARGGGSLEDLWAFNDRLVADAIFEAQTPIVSAIGHDTDTPISDFVADVRAPTPSAAMEIILPDQYEWLLRLDTFHHQINQILSQKITQKKRALKNQQLHLSLAVSSSNIEAHKNKLNYYQNILQEKYQRFLQNKQDSLSRALQQHHEHLKRKLIAHTKHLESLLYKLNHMGLDIMFQNKRKQLMFWDKHLNKLQQQILHNKQQKLTQLSSHLDLLNPALLQKKGFVQIWHNNQVGDLAYLSQGDIFEVSDGFFKASVKLINKTSLQSNSQ